MTVRELIDRLREKDPDATVYVGFAGSYAPASTIGRGYYDARTGEYVSAGSREWLSESYDEAHLASGVFVQGAPDEGRAALAERVVETVREEFS